MQNNQQLVNYRKTRQKILFLSVCGVAIVVAIGVMVGSSLEQASPPAPPVQMHYPRVHLTVQSNVGGADVYLQNKLITVISDTHRRAKLLNLARKTHQITLRKAGYVDRTEEVEITGKTPSQTVQIDLQADGASGFLE